MKLPHNARVYFGMKNLSRKEKNTRSRLRRSAPFCLWISTGGVAFAMEKRKWKLNFPGFWRGTVRREKQKKKVLLSVLLHPLPAVQKTWAKKSNQFRLASPHFRCRSRWRPSRREAELEDLIGCCRSRLQTMTLDAHWIIPFTLSFYLFYGHCYSGEREREGHWKTKLTSGKQRRISGFSAPDGSNFSGCPLHFLPITRWNGNFLWLARDIAPFDRIVTSAPFYFSLKNLCKFSFLAFGNSYGVTCISTSCQNKMSMCVHIVWELCCLCNIIEL